MRVRKEYAKVCAQREEEDAVCREQPCYRKSRSTLMQVEVSVAVAKYNEVVSVGKVDEEDERYNSS